MAEDDGTITSDNLTANGSDTSPAVGIISQYIKDMSVENPNAPDAYQWGGQPKIDVQFNIGSRKLNDEVHEVELKITVTATADQGTAFIVELAYAGLIGMRNVPEDQVQPFLYAEAPRILFPFARRILADAVRDAGFQPLMLEPIDFNALYVQQRAEHDRQQAAGEQPAGNA
ncbi:MAG: protein-export chaperone SecB [Pseudomonadota bacterium]